MGNPCPVPTPDGYGGSIWVLPQHYSPVVVQGTPTVLMLKPLDGVSAVRIDRESFAPLVAIITALLTDTVPAPGETFTRQDVADQDGHDRA